MKFVDFYGDDRLRHKIVYDKRFYSECIYCGAQADTREHIPSKVFLDRPYPENLAIVPACSQCNNSFSKDELFVSILIEKLKEEKGCEKYMLSEESMERITRNEKLVNKIEKAIGEKSIHKFDKVVSRILFKLAIGHAVYEVSEGYCIEDGIANYTFINNMSKVEREEFCTPFILNDEVLPEIGSRIFERIKVLEVDLADVSNPAQRIQEKIVLLDWVEVQKSKYIYTCFHFGDKIVVKMIINDFLCVKVVVDIDN